MMKRTVKIENVGIVGPLFASGSIWWVSGRKKGLVVCCAGEGAAAWRRRCLSVFFIHAPLSQLPVG